MPNVQQGSVIRAWVTDPRDGNPKPRPLVVVSTTSEISRTATFIAVAITGEFSEPLQADEVLLPWHPQGRCKSGLTKPCVAKCSWMRQLLLADVIEVKGHLRGKELDDVVTEVGLE